MRSRTSSEGGGYSAAEDLRPCQQHLQLSAAVSAEQHHSVTTPLSPLPPIPSLYDAGRATQVALERGGRVDVLQKRRVQRDEYTYSHSQMPQASSIQPDSTPRSRLLGISSKFHTNIYSPSLNVALFSLFSFRSEDSNPGIDPNHTIHQHAAIHQHALVGNARNTP